MPSKSGDRRRQPAGSRAPPRRSRRGPQRGGPLRVRAGASRHRRAAGSHGVRRRAAEAEESSPTGPRSSPRTWWTRRSGSPSRPRRGFPARCRYPIQRPSTRTCRPPGFGLSSSPARSGATGACTCAVGRSSARPIAARMRGLSGSAPHTLARVVAQVLDGRSRGPSGPVTHQTMTPVPGVHLAGRPAVGDRASARKPERPARSACRRRRSRFTGQDRVVREDHLARSRVLREVLEEEVELTSRECRATVRIHRPLVSRGRPSRRSAGRQAAAAGLRWRRCALLTAAWGGHRPGVTACGGTHRLSRSRRRPAPTSLAALEGRKARNQTGKIDDVTLITCSFLPQRHGG